MRSNFKIKPVNLKLLFITLLLPILISCTGKEVSVVHGTIFEDNNNNDQLDIGDSPRVKVKIYADLDNNGQFNEGEPATYTNSQGRYILGVPAGDTIHIRQEMDFGWRNSIAGKDDQVTPVVVSSPEELSNSAEYPFATFLISKDENGRQRFCSGVLISDRWGLTAGHCIDSLNLPFVGAFIGIAGAGAEGADESIVEITNLIRHPDFQFLEVADGQTVEEFFASFGDDLSPTEVLADIAVFELAQPIDLEASGITSVTMAETAPDTNTFATITGYGPSDSSTFGVGILKEVHLLTQDIEFCEAGKLEPRPFNSETQICVGYPEGGAGVCPGDSGSPLIVKNADETSWLLTGIGSYGPVQFGCGFDAPPNAPNYFMSVPFYKPWIEANALEPSVSFSIDVEPGAVYLGHNFANTSTLRESSTELLKDRYQLTSSSLSIEDNNTIQVEGFIRDEVANGRNFQCGISLFDPEVLDHVFDCTAMNNTSTLSDSDIDPGIYALTLSVALGNDDPDKIERSFERIVIGNVEESVINDSLSEGDLVQLVEGENIRHIYNLEVNTDTNGVIRITAVSDEITSLQLVLLNRDTFESTASINESYIDFGNSDAVGESIGFDFTPVEGLNYSILIESISSSSEDETEGGYQLTLLNGADANLRDTIPTPPESNEEEE